MIPLDRVRACGRPTCRAVLPADPEDEPGAGFWAAAREGGAGSRVRRWQSWCKDCQRERVRTSAGIRRRGRAYEPRRAGTPEERRRRNLERRRKRRAELMKDPATRKVHRERDRERARVRRRRAGIPPRYPKRRVEGLPAEPLVLWLREATKRQGQAAIARRARISPDRIRNVCRGYYFHNLRSGESRRYRIKRVSLEFADRVVRAGGGVLDEVWPGGLV